jgi:hypothetical protein
MKIFLVFLVLTFEFSTSQIKWEKCPEIHFSTEIPNLECAYHSVPLNWNKKLIGNTTYFLRRLKSKNRKGQVRNIQNLKKSFG